MKLVLKSGKSKKANGTVKHIGMVSNCYNMGTRMNKEMRQHVQQARLHDP